VGERGTSKKPSPERFAICRHSSAFFFHHADTSFHFVFFDFLFSLSLSFSSSLFSSRTHFSTFNKKTPNRVAAPVSPLFFLSLFTRRGVVFFFPSCLSSSSVDHQRRIAAVLNTVALLRKSVRLGHNKRLHILARHDIGNLLLARNALRRVHGRVPLLLR